MILLMVCHAPAPGQVHLADDNDRAALRAWFVLLSDAQFYRPTPDVADCAALVRHAVREALRPHTPDWLRRMGLPAVAPEIRQRPVARDGALPLFRVGGGAAERSAEFADARTIIRLNSRPVGRDPAALRPGDLLYFRQDAQRLPDHLMVFVGRSLFEPEGDDWVVYHTGPSPTLTGSLHTGEGASAAVPAEVRKVRLADLLRYPASHWRPTTANPAFVGIYRLSMM